MPSRIVPHPQLWTKIGLALGLVLLADLVVHDNWAGATSATLAAAAVLSVAVAHRRTLRNPVAACAMTVAAACALLPFERPSLLGWLFFWIALAIAALAPRLRRADDAATVLVRIAAALSRAPLAPFRDLDLVRKARQRGGRRQPITAAKAAGLLALPLVGCVTFAGLFVAANPVLGQALARLRLPQLDLFRLILWAIFAIGFWLLLRPRVRPRFLRRLKPIVATGRDRATAASVVLSLALFNLLFAVQNGLDIAYLWSGASLPTGMSFAEYAHRGAYPLILTALLAGAFVLVFLRPGSEVAKFMAARGLVIAWVAQNVFLVGSTALRTLDYIEAYSLTRMRIAALAWMGLVAVGLALIGWRLLRGKSSVWLINANAAAAGLVLAVCAVVDLGAVAATWNVRHARELGASGAALDLCYLGELGPSAAVALSELATQPLPPTLQQRIADARNVAVADLAQRQNDWRRWTWRGERRLARALEIAGPPGSAGSNGCEWAPPAQPLTPPPPAGT